MIIRNKKKKRKSAVPPGHHVRAPHQKNIAQREGKENVVFGKRLPRKVWKTCWLDSHFSTGRRCK